MNWPIFRVYNWGKKCCFIREVNAILWLVGFILQHFSFISTVSANSDLAVVQLNDIKAVMWLLRHTWSKLAVMLSPMVELQTLLSTVPIISLSLIFFSLRIWFDMTCIGKWCMQFLAKMNADRSKGEIFFYTLIRVYLGRVKMRFGRCTLFALSL